MKTVKGLHEKMYTFDNANISFHKAAENKRFHEEVLAFSMSKEDELLRACEEVETLTYSQGPYTVFKVWEPKERLIMALPFYDRVVQHMIVNAIGPVFEERFYCHSYACREGKGMHAASNQLYKWLYELMVVQELRIYAFKGDISKYFASIPHDGLKDENRRYIGDKKALPLSIFTNASRVISMSKGAYILSRTGANQKRKRSCMTKSLPYPKIRDLKRKWEIILA